MVQSSESQCDESTDKSLGVMDCGASITITGSLLNCIYVKEHETIIEEAKEGESIVTTHACSMTVKNRGKFHFFSEIFLDSANFLR